MKMLSAALCAALCFPVSAQAQNRPVATQCQADIERYCPDIGHVRGAVRLCLEQHVTLVTLDCRTALETTGSRNERAGWGKGLPGRSGMGLRQLIATVEGLGYSDIREIKFQGGHYEVEATDQNGVRVEMYVDAVTGKILRTEPED